MSVTIPWAKPHSFPEEVDYVTDAIRSNWISDGAWLKKFEDSFAQIHDSTPALTTSNGTTALQLALLALDLQPDDEVIVPGFSFVAPGNMVLACGAKPVFADIDPGHWNLTVQTISEKVSTKTKAIIHVHNYGVTGPIDEIRDYCQTKNLHLIEDVAEACFSKLKGQMAGTFGHIGCFSFQATKTITTGEGGMVLTRDPALFEKMRKIRSHGMDPSKRYWHTEVGYNFRMTNLQAAFGCAQLLHLDWILQRRRELYEAYVDRLSQIPNILLQTIHPGCDPAMWALGVRLIDASETQRDSVRTFLAEKGIETRPGFYPYSKMPLYQRLASAQSVPHAELISAQTLTLPFFLDLKDSEVDFVVTSLKAAIRLNSTTASS